MKITRQVQSHKMKTIHQAQESQDENYSSGRGITNCKLLAKNIIHHDKLLSFLTFIRPALNFSIFY